MTQTERKRSTGHTGYGRVGRLLNILFTLALVGLPGVALAQIDQARITGLVRDQNSAMVPGATITVKNERTGETRTTTSKEDGSFAISNLKPSLYTIQVTAGNFAKSEYTRVEIVVGQVFDLAVVMKPAGSTESVTIVGGEEAPLDTSSARMGANVNEAEVKGLPLNGRQLSQLYLQAPGALNSGSGTFVDIRFSGRANQQNEVRFDGIEGTAIIDASPGNVNGEVATPFRLQSSLENVQEFRVESNSYPAEYGTGTGGQITVVTKSGSNQFHGSAFEYLRNDALDARNFFDRVTQSPLKLNQFGASIGGPVIKDKFFFFGSYEGYRLRAGVNLVSAIPSAAACAGAVAAVQPLCPAAFRGPGSIILPGASKDPNFDIAQLQANSPVNENSGSIRLDFKPSDKNSFYARFFRDQGFSDQPQDVSGSRAGYRSVPQNGVVAWQTTIGATKVNELKVGYNSAYSRVFGSAPTVNGIDLSAVTINITGSVANAGIPGQGASSGVGIPGGLFRLNSATNGRGAPYTPYSVSFIDNLSALSGNHSLKFGTEVRLVRLYTDRLGGTTYSYSNLANFLTNTAATVQYLGDLSAPSPFNNGVTGNRLAKSEYYIGYAQDEWRIRPNLTLNYGLRYEYYSPLREDQNRDVVFNITTGTILPPDTQALMSRKTNFGPRIGLSYSPEKSLGFLGGGKTVFRSGFGIYYGPGQTEDQIQPIESDRINSTFSNLTNAFPLNIPQTVANFNNNPNNRSFQPRAYDTPNYSIPERIYSYTASIQQELPYKMTLTAAYVGSQGRNLFLRSVANQITQVLTNANPAQNAIVIRQFSVVTNNGPGVNPTVLNPFAEVDFKRSGGHDSYNALQLSLGRRFNTGITLNAQYAYSTSRGNTAGSNEAQTVGNNALTTSGFDYDNGYNNFDVRQTFNFSAIYALPFGKNLSGVSRTLAGGWEIGAIANVRSGLPINLLITRPDVVYVDAAGNVYSVPAAGRAAVINTPGGGATRATRRPNLVAGVNPFLDADRTILNPAAFTTPAPGTFGNLERNLLHGPGFFQQDLVVSKKFALTERANVEFRTEVYNLFNTTNFANPPATLNNSLCSSSVVALPTDPSYCMAVSSTGVRTPVANVVNPGQAFTAGSAGAAFGINSSTVSKTVGLGSNRQIQFALRLNF